MHRLSKNILYVYLRVVFVTILGIITARLSFQVLGQSDYGLFNVVGGIISVLAIISTAMSTTVRRYINVELGKEDGNPNKIFNICLLINVCISILLFVLAETIGLWYIDNYLNVANDKLGAALKVFHICTLTSAISLINVPHQSLITAHEHFKAVAIIDVGTQLIKLIGVACLFYIQSDRIIYYATIVCIVTLLSLFIYSAYCKRNWGEIVRFKIWKDRSIYKEIIVFNNYIAIGAASYVARTQGSNMLINYFFGTLVNGAFSIAYMLENYAMIIISNLTVAAAPRITKEYSSGDISNAVKTASRINRLSIVFMITIVFIIFIELPTLLKLWLGELPQDCVVLCQWTLISAVTRSLSEGLPPIIQASGRIKWFQITSSCVQISVLAFGWFLFKKGYAPETIIITFVVATFVNFLINFLLMRVVLSWNEIMYFIRNSLLRGGALIAVLSTYYILNRVIFPSISPWLNIFIGAVLSLAAVFVIGLTSDERKMIGNTIKKRINIL